MRAYIVVIHFFCFFIFSFMFLVGVLGVDELGFEPNWVGVAFAGAFSLGYQICTLIFQLKSIYRQYLNA